MLRSIKGLNGDAIRASDGDIGHVEDILFDDQRWTVRYVVVDTGGWLSGRKVLITAAALNALDWDHHVLSVNLTRDQVENSPDVDTALPVSRQWEKDYHDHYGLPYYWAGVGLANSTGVSGAPWNPGAILAVSAVDAAVAQAKNERALSDDPNEHDDAHLRSSREVTGYKIITEDGRLGHVDDFIVDDAAWQIGYLAVDTRDLWPGKKVLLPHGLVTETNWPDETVIVEVTRDDVQNAPEWHPEEPITSAFEIALSTYYGGLRSDASRTVGSV